MNRKEDFERLDTMRNQALEGGGAQRRQKQHERGKLDARERITALVDTESFVETQRYMSCRNQDFGLDKHQTPGDGVVTGSGVIDKRQVWISSQDFTVLGGSLGEQHARRIAHVQEMALKTGKPFIQINDSGGARIQEGIYSLDGYGKIFRNNIIGSGVIPQLSLILGPCAGGAAYSPALTDFVFMVDKTSQMYITGPDVIRTVTGEQVTHEQLGGARTHTQRSGNVHFYCTDEHDCFSKVRQLLSYLPSNNREQPPRREDKESKGRASTKVSEILPERASKAYDVIEIIHEICDRGSFLEVHKEYAKNLVVGFARLGGRSVGIIANQPKMLSGTLDINSSDKGARFVRTCDAFNVPVISLVDVPGYMPGTVQEYGGIIRHGAKLLYAIGEASVPKISLVLRKAYGGAYIAMASKALGYDRVLALPSSEIAVMGAEGAAEIIYRREIAQAEDTEGKRAQKVEEFRQNIMNPFVASRAGMVDEVVLPEEIRNELIRSLEMLMSKHESRPMKKHGNLPV